jgi:hypothetical protein
MLFTEDRALDRFVSRDFAWARCVRDNGLLRCSCCFDNECGEYGELALYSVLLFVCCLLLLMIVIVMRFRSLKDEDRLCQRSLVCGWGTVRMMFEEE